jgi:hypothetical protein
LYLSFPGSLSPEWDDRLQHLKDAAQSDLAEVRASAQLSLGDHVFEVSRRGRMQFKFLLVDAWYEIAVSGCGAGALPLVWIKVSSARLLDADCGEVLDDLRRLLAPLGVGGAPEAVSRLDLCVDFTTSYPIAAIDRRQWVARARKVACYWHQDEHTGWSFGGRGTISGRLYDKTLEIERSGKGYLRDVWHDAGWSGEAPVWRLEFEYGREFLKDLDLSTLDQLIPAYGSLWLYAMRDWLRLVEVGADTNRARWQNADLWNALEAADWVGAARSTLARSPRNRWPSEDFLFVNGLGALTSYMAMEGYDDLHEGTGAYLRAAGRYHEHRRKVSGVNLRQYVRQQVAVKRCRYNVLNPPRRRAEHLDDTGPERSGDDR